MNQPFDAMLQAGRNDVFRPPDRASLKIGTAAAHCRPNVINDIDACNGPVHRLWITQIPADLVYQRIGL